MTVSSDRKIGMSIMMPDLRFSVDFLIDRVDQIIDQIDASMDNPEVGFDGETDNPASLTYEQRLRASADILLDYSQAATDGHISENDDDDVLQDISAVFFYLFAKIQGVDKLNTAAGVMATLEDRKIAFSIYEKHDDFEEITKTMFEVAEYTGDKKRIDWSGRSIVH